MNFYLGLDLGKMRDYTALALIEKVEEPTGEMRYEYNRSDEYLPQPVKEKRFHLRYLDRLKLGTPYPAVVRHTKNMLQRPEIAGKTVCIIDKTGGGIPVFDMFHEADVMPLVGITITGGDAVSRVGDSYRVPKRDLVSTMHVLYQNKRFRIAGEIRDHELGGIFVHEMQNFHKKISLAGHDSYEAWREGDHDDLVLAVALALWYAWQEKDYGGAGYAMI